MIYDTIYDFFVQILGETAMNDGFGRGELFATYGTYIIIACGIFALFKILGGVLRLVKPW